jgi:membrane-bound lytic murein transglycosylase D
MMARAASATVCFAVAVPALASCGGDTLGVATTVVGVTPTAFATIPPVASTQPGTTTTLPANAVGQETVYTVVAGDSPISVATKFGITVSLLLSYNALLTPGDFPYPGQTLKIPAAAITPTETNPPAGGGGTPASTPAGPVGPGCGTRPAGTYTIQQGDSMWAITKKFCITTAQLVAANEWPDGGVTLLPGQVISIPAANG